MGWAYIGKATRLGFWAISLLTGPHHTKTPSFGLHLKRRCFNQQALKPLNPLSSQKKKKELKTINCHSRNARNCSKPFFTQKVETPSLPFTLNLSPIPHEPLFFFFTLTNPKPPTSKHYQTPTTQFVLLYFFDPIFVPHPRWKL